ncbi:MAG: 23S rRNA (adenine(2503)-C(2))-methyltransferase RlmN, partial [Actinobacteria bacterium]|nr:23S rRNA (adenine(2503)-C(2))-methyltransferase RlmN [Actinomycetota bacterium]
GEPFANYEASLDALRLMNSPDALGIGARHLTVSTCGLTTGIDRFAQEPEQFTLAISLHSAVQATRDTLMPGVRGIPLRALRASVSAYAERTGRRPSFEFALIDGVNDSDAELGALIEFTRGLLCHVNLIPVNTIEGSALRRVTQQRALEFLNALVHSGTESSIRTERGADIDAACGQLKQTASAER